MYCDMVYRNDELGRDLEQASRAAARGWRFRHMHSGTQKGMVTAFVILGRILIGVGQWLALGDSSSLAYPA
jgi:hypothetical protein